MALTCLSESFMASTCLSESFMASTFLSESFMASTCLSESYCAESLIVDWIVHPFNYFIISARMPEESRLLYDTFVSFFCALIATGDWNEVSVVTLLTLLLVYFSSSSVTLITSSQRFLLDNGFPWRQLCLFRWYNVSLRYSSFGVVMQALLYDMSSLSKTFFRIRIC